MSDRLSLSNYRLFWFDNVEYDECCDMIHKSVRSTTVEKEDDADDQEEHEEEKESFFLSVFFFFRTH